MYAGSILRVPSVANVTICELLQSPPTLWPRGVTCQLGTHPLALLLSGPPAAGYTAEDKYPLWKFGGYGGDFVKVVSCIEISCLI